MKKALLLFTIAFIIIVLFSMSVDSEMIPSLELSVTGDTDDHNDLLSSSENSEFKFSELLPGFNKNHQPKKNYNKLIRNIKDYLKDKEGTYGISFLSLTENRRLGINDTELFNAASTTKVPINLYLYDRIIKKKLSPYDMIVYEDSDYEEGTGSIQYMDLYQEFSLEELSRLSIVESDNVAINMLVRHLGWDNVKAYMDSIVKREVDFENNYFTPRDMVTYLKAVLDLSKTYEEAKTLLEYLGNTIYNDRMPLYLPEGTVVAHKVGSQVCVVNDIGIVFSEKPFILAILSRDVNEEEAPDVIGTITKMIYDYELE